MVAGNAAAGHVERAGDTARNATTVQIHAAAVLCRAAGDAAAGDAHEACAAIGCQRALVEVHAAPVAGGCAAGDGADRHGEGARAAVNVYAAAVDRRAVADGAARDGQLRPIVQVYAAAVAAVDLRVLQRGVAAQGDLDRCIRLDDAGVIIRRHSVFGTAVQHNIGQSQVGLSFDHGVVAHPLVAQDGSAGAFPAPIRVHAVGGSCGGQGNVPARTAGSGDKILRRVVLHQHLHLIVGSSIQCSVHIIQIFAPAQRAEGAGGCFITGIAGVQPIKHRGPDMFTVNIQRPVVAVGDLADRVAAPDDLFAGGVLTVHDAVERAVVRPEDLVLVSEACRIDKRSLGRAELGQFLFRIHHANLAADTTVDLDTIRVDDLAAGGVR